MPIPAIAVSSPRRFNISISTSEYPSESVRRAITVRSYGRTSIRLRRTLGRPHMNSGDRLKKEVGPDGLLNKQAAPKSGQFRLALQLPFMEFSESMGNHDSKIVGADSVD